MKFLTFTIYHVDKLGELAKALDKLAASASTGESFALSSWLQHSGLHSLRSEP